MKKYNFKISILFISFVFSYYLSFAQSLNIHQLDGKMYSYDLDIIQKLTFEKEIIKLTLKDGSFYQHDMDVVKKYTYSDKSLGIEKMSNSYSLSEINLFPNPVSNEVNLYLNLIKPSEISLFIYELDGNFVKNLNFNNLPIGISHQQIDLSELVNGNYLFYFICDDYFVVRKIVKANI